MKSKHLGLLQKYGLLLLSDAILPSVSSLIAGAPIRGSWWGHPLGHAIYNAASELADHPDVIITKLISGKVTYVHRKLWPALIVLATSHEVWQMRSISSAARSLLSRVTKEGTLQTDQLRKGRAQKTGETVRELEKKLLVYSEEVHTERGTHAKCLESWDHWANRVELKRQNLTPEQARKLFEEKLSAMNLEFGAKGKLPW